MALSKPIETLRQELQTQLIEDIAGVLRTLKEILPEQSDKFAWIVGLLGRLNDANKASIRKTMSNDELQIEYNKIRADLFDLIKDLQETDFAAGTAGADGGQAAARQGSVLYRIPKSMPKQKETKCVVRIAMSEEAIVENITIDDQVVLKDLYRISDTMQAEILDPSGGRVFRISTISDPIQIIDQQGYTEWWFYVTPLEEGIFPLVLKISIIELVNGQPRPKELVMEETVQIVAEDAAPEQAGESELKPAGYALSFETSAPVQVAYNVAAAAPAAGATQGGGSSNPLRKAAMAIALLVFGTAVTWAFTPADLRAWAMTRYVKDTPQAMQEFIEKYPASKHREMAVFRKARLLDTPAEYREYARAFPEGKYTKAALQALMRLELAALEQFRKTQNAASLRAFLTDFPESPYLETVRRLVGQNDALRNWYLPLVQQQLEECRRLEALTNFVEQLPPVADMGGDPNPATQTNEADGSNDRIETATEGTAARPEQAAHTAPQAPGKLPAPAPPAVATARPETQPVRGVKPLKPDMVWVDGGTFQMGSDQGVNDEKPVHAATLDGFWIGKYEVTFAEYDLFCAATARAKPDDEGWGREKRPVIHVNWFDAVAYCNWLSAQDGLVPAYAITADTIVALRMQANGYRLPTEAEWEYAARGGIAGGTNVYSGGNDNDLDAIAWYSANARGKTQPVGLKKANELGVYDMTGNVREWCYDFFSSYPANAVANPGGRATGKDRVLRGGRWDRNPVQLRSTYRAYTQPKYQDYGTGFRLTRRK